MFIETSIHHADGGQSPIVLAVEERPYGLLLAGESRELILPPGAGVHFDFESAAFGGRACATAINPLCPHCGRIHL